MQMRFCGGEAEPLMKPGQAVLTQVWGDTWDKTSAQVFMFTPASVFQCWVSGRHHVGNGIICIDWSRSIDSEGVNSSELLSVVHPPHLSFLFYSSLVPNHLKFYKKVQNTFWWNSTTKHFLKYLVNRVKMWIYQKWWGEMKHPLLS